MCERGVLLESTSFSGVVEVDAWSTAMIFPHSTLSFDLLIYYGGCKHILHLAREFYARLRYRCNAQTALSMNSAVLEKVVN
jgi:hypothetical protein